MFFRAHNFDMDDIYFSDNKKKDKKKANSADRISSGFEERDFIQDITSGESVRNTPPSERRYTKNAFTDNDYSDEEFSLDFKKKGSSSAFQSIPEYHPYEVPDIQPPVSREPKGKPLKDTTQPNRTPQGSRVAPEHKPSADYQHNPKKRKKKKSGKAKIILALLALVLVLGVSFGVYGYTVVSDINYTERKENKYVSSAELISSPDVRNILLVGCDSRDEVQGNRSDTVILLSIDQKNKKLKLTSFLRDSFVYIPEKGFSNKLNSTFNYGGFNMLMDTLEYNFKIKIDNYVMVDFNAFRQLVNLLGGITVDGVTEKEARYMRDEVKIPSVKEGTNHMNGKTALWYCRIRYVDNDFRRTERQRKVIMSIIDKATKTDIFTLMNICKEVVPNISTDISTPELLSLAVNAALSYLRYDIVQQQIPADGEWADRWVGTQQVVALDLEANKKILKEFIYE